jgi:putative ABC transport system permease protein
VTLGGLVIRNLSRNKVRVGLTVLGVSVAIVAFLLLRTVSWAWGAASANSAKDRIVTRHKVTFVLPLPKRYVDDVRATPHVARATWATWFGGQDPRHDREFFMTLAVDSATYFDVYREGKLSQAELEAFQHDRQGAVVGDQLAKKLGWNIGDKVALQSGTFPGEWQFTIDGIYTATAKAVNRSEFLFHWDYLNDSVPPSRRDQVGWIASAVDDPSRVAEVSAALDRRFEGHEVPTLSQDENTFNRTFLAMFAAVLQAMDLISVVILVILMLILGNTIAMAVRERTGEYAVLRAVGFLPRHVALWVVAEALVMGAAGGLLGIGVAWPFINLVVGRFVEENMGSYLPVFRLEAPAMIVGATLAALLGGAAALLPAGRTSQLRVGDAVRKVV